jgi:hypothetical protein
VLGTMRTSAWQPRSPRISVRASSGWFYRRARRCGFELLRWAYPVEAPTPMRAPAGLATPSVKNSLLSSRWS